MRLRSALPLLLLLAAPGAWSATHQVGPTRPHATLDALFAAVDLAGGDVVEVDGGVTYAGGVIVPPADGGSPGNPVVIRGLRASGLRPVLSGGTNTIEFRRADHVVFEGFEVTGGSSRCVFVVAHEITLRDLLIHDCPSHGVLSADSHSGTLTLEFSEIHSAGSGTTRHALYIQSDEMTHPGSVFRMRCNYVHSGTGGNLLKSRHERSEIHYNWFEGAAYHELELIGPDAVTQLPGWTPDLVREDQDVVGNVIVHSNPGFGAVIRVGGDGSGESRGRVRFANNTIAVTSGRDATVFRIFDGIQAVEAHNNVLAAPSGGILRVERTVEAQWTNGRQVGGSNNWVQSDATYLPPEWIGTLLGTSAGFVNAGGLNFIPTAGSPLLDAANPAPQPIPGYAVPDTLFPPTLQPQRGPDCTPRLASGTLDIGALERDANALFVDGFEG